MKKINILEAIKYPIGTKFCVWGNDMNAIILATDSNSSDGDLPTKKLVWEDGQVFIGTDYELSLEFMLL